MTAAAWSYTRIQVLTTLNLPYIRISVYGNTKPSENSSKEAVKQNDSRGILYKEDKLSVCDDAWLSSKRWATRHRKFSDTWSWRTTPESYELAIRSDEYKEAACKPSTIWKIP